MWLNMIKLAVIFGGKSTENEVSKMSAKSVLNNLDKNKYKIFPIYIDKFGIWINYETNEEIKNIETSADTVIFDGIISQRLVDVASLKGIKRLVAFRSMNIVKKPDNLKIITMD